MKRHAPIAMKLRTYGDLGAAKEDVANTLRILLLYSAAQAQSGDPGTVGHNVGGDSLDTGAVCEVIGNCLTVTATEMYLLQSRLTTAKHSGSYHIVSSVLTTSGPAHSITVNL